MGVFATRSPFRPNPIGLSSVKIEGIEKTDEGDVIIVKGADILSGTPIYDIKPYLKFTDSHEDAVGGFADDVLSYSLEVEFPDEELLKIPEQKRSELITLLSNDPRPSYKAEGEREYGMKYAGCEVYFTVQGGTLRVSRVSLK